MLSCKDVARRASDCLEEGKDRNIHWQMRLHLMMCSNCRRFARHLKITQQVSTAIARQQQLTDPEIIWQKLNNRLINEKKQKD